MNAPTIPPLAVKSILVPTDFSPPARRALDYAIGFAQRFGAHINLLSVVAPPGPGDSGNLPLGDGFPLEPARRELAGLADRLIPADLAGERAVRIGSPAEVIVEFARKARADIIILGTHGRTDLAHVFMGSTAERVVRHAGCPVLVVRRRVVDEDLVRSAVLYSLPAR